MDEPRSETKAMFQDRAAVEAELALPAVVSHSFVGPGTPEFGARLEHLLEELAGPDAIRKRSYKASSGGKFVAYRYEVFYERMEALEAVYRAVGALPGVRFVI